MDQRDNLLGVLSVIYRWRKAIRNVCALTAVGAVVFALLQDNYYKGTTIFYPASPGLSNPELIFGYTGQVTDYFGSDRELDRLAEIANSAEVTDYMVVRFKLFDHYKIDSSSDKGRNYVRDRFRGLYTAEKNKNDALTISVEDTDPQLAADMANAARDKISEIAQRLIKNSQAKLLATFDENLNKKTQELIMLGDSLQRLQARFGIYSIEQQGEQLTARLNKAESQIALSRARLSVLEKDPNVPRDTIAYIRANLRAYEQERQGLRNNDSGQGTLNVRNFNEGQAAVAILTDLHFQARKQLSFDRERYGQIRAAYNTNIPAVQIIENAERPQIKSRPKRSLIVLSAILGAFIFTVFVALIAEAYRDVKWQDITKGE